MRRHCGANAENTKRSSSGRAWPIAGAIVTHPKPLILVVDDDAQVRRLVRSILRSDTFRLIEVATGLEGLGQAKACQPDVVLVDLALPDMDGVEVIRELRKWLGAPILVISGLAD